MNQNYNMCKGILFFLWAAIFAIVPPVQAEEVPGTKQNSDAELAQQLSNPIADLITIPVQMNFDYDIGPRDDGWKLQTNIQEIKAYFFQEDFL